MAKIVKHKAKKKPKKYTVPIIVLFVFVLVFSSVFIFVRQTVFSDTFTPIYCNDYEFYCCSQVLDRTVTQSWGNAYSDYFVCDGDADYCEVTSTGDINVFTTSSNNIDTCIYKEGFLSLDGWVCDGGKNLGSSLYGYKIYAGDRLYPQTWATQYSNLFNVQIKVYKRKLFFTGTSAEIGGGVEVIGSDKCYYNLDGTLSDDSGTLKYDSYSDTSYTIPAGQCNLAWQSGNRHICGNFEERCDYDSDCGGHTYGNYECTGRTLQKYKCQKLREPPSELKIINSEYVAPFDKSVEARGTADIYGTILLTRCEAVSTTVQCCGDTDCGSNAFCDNNPASPTAWTCQAQGTVECTEDYNCGLSEQCNPETKQIVSPECRNNKCYYDNTKDVVCCTDKDCSTGYYCSNDKSECKLSTGGKTECPYGCCESETRYFDRLCQGGDSCCPDNECRETCEIVPPPPCDTICQLKSNLTIVSIILSVFAGLGMFIYLYNTFEANKPKKKREPINTIIFFAISVALGLLIYFMIKLFKDFLFSWLGLGIVIGISSIAVIMMLFIKKLNL